MDCSFIFNETIEYSLNRSEAKSLYLDYDLCPESYSKATKPLVVQCCLNIIINKLGDSYMTKIQSWLTHYGSSLLVVPAVFFNLLSFLVLSSFSKLNTNATSINFYMKSLCVFDTLTILSIFLHDHVVVRNQIRENPFKINSSACKLTHFSESTFGITSIYILILMSFDKLICVAFPFKSGSILTPNRAKLMCIFVLLFSAIYSSYHFFIHKVHIYKKPTNTTMYDCAFSNEIAASKMIIVDNFVRVFLPIIFLCICNLLIVIALAKARKTTMSVLFDKANDPKAVKNLPNNNNNPDEVEMILIKVNSNEHLSKPLNDRINQVNSKADKNSNYISIMLFTVSFGFIVLNLPYAINTIYEQNFKEKQNVLDLIFDSNNYDLMKN